MLFSNFSFLRLLEESARRIDGSEEVPNYFLGLEVAKSGDSSPIFDFWAFSSTWSLMVRGEIDTEFETLEVMIDLRLDSLYGDLR